VVDAITTLGTPSSIPLRITSVEWVCHRRGRSNRIKRSQKKKNLSLVTPLTITSKVEEVKDSPILEVPKEEKWKETQEGTKIKE